MKFLFLFFAAASFFLSGPGVADDTTTFRLGLVLGIRDGNMVLRLDQYDLPEANSRAVIFTAEQFDRFRNRLYIGSSVELALDFLEPITSEEELQRWDPDLLRPPYFRPNDQFFRVKDLDGQRLKLEHVFEQDRRLPLLRFTPSKCGDAWG